MATTDVAPTARTRMTLSQVVELLLTRGHSDRSSVSLSRNARGETQVEVVVRTGDDLPTVDEAEAAAVLVYERLRARYPLSSGYVANTANEPAPAKRHGEGAPAADGSDHGQLV